MSNFKETNSYQYLLRVAIYTMVAVSWTFSFQSRFYVFALLMFLICFRYVIWPSICMFQPRWVTSELQQWTFKVGVFSSFYWSSKSSYNLYKLLGIDNYPPDRDYTNPSLPSEQKGRTQVCFFFLFHYSCICVYQYIYAFQYLLMYLYFVVPVWLYRCWCVRRSTFWIRRRWIILTPTLRALLNYSTYYCPLTIFCFYFFAVGFTQVGLVPVTMHICH